MPDHPVITAANAFRARLERAEAQALSRLAESYWRSYQRITAQMDRLLLAIGDNKPTRGQLVRMRRYKDLQEQIVNEIQGFQTMVTNETEAAADFGISQGVRDGRELISYAAVGTNQIAAQFNALPTDAIKTLLGFLSPDGALYSRLAELAPYTTAQVADTFITGVTLGYNPRKIAGMVRQSFGAGLTDALRFVRTAQIWSYREANLATYIANSDVVEGWIWHTQFDDRTCMSCIALHGTFHPLDEALNDHHNGRCAPIPAVKGFDNPIEQGGEDWFKAQNESVQRKLMGAKKWQAWKDGKFKFPALVGEYDNDVYGRMRVERSLKGILEDG